MNINQSSISVMSRAAHLACMAVGEDPRASIVFEGVETQRWVSYAVQMIRLQAMINALRSFGLSTI